MKRALVWFTSDLRWHDNQALFEAITENEEILFCYCWNETFMNSEQLASRRVGNHRKRYLIQALIQLKNSPTKPFSPGTAILEQATKTRKKAYLGITDANPPKSSNWRLCRLS